MKLIISELDVETTLEDFVNDWDLDIEEVKEELDNDDYYEGGNGFFMIEKSEDNKFLTVEIIDGHYEIFESLNGIYEHKYLLFFKDVFWGRDENDDDVEFTTWDIEGIYNNKFIFKGDENDSKKLCNKDEEIEFENFIEEGVIETTHKDQEFLFVKEKDFNLDKWLKYFKELPNL